MFTSFVVKRNEAEAEIFSSVGNIAIEEMLILGGRTTWVEITLLPGLHCRNIQFKKRIIISSNLIIKATGHFVYVTFKL